jgi:hypothetical protein
LLEVAAVAEHLHKALVAVVAVPVVLELLQVFQYQLEHLIPSQLVLVVLVALEVNRQDQMPQTAQTLYFHQSHLLVVDLEALLINSLKRQGQE